MGTWGKGYMWGMGRETCFIATWSAGLSSRTRDARTRDIWASRCKSALCGRAASCGAMTWYDQVSMHGIRPQGHSYAQVTLLSYDMFYVFHVVYDPYVQVTAWHDMFYVSMRLLFMYTLLTMLLFMSYILSTLFVLTPLLRGLRFMPRRYTQTDRSQGRRCFSEVGKTPLVLECRRVSVHVPWLLSTDRDFADIVVGFGSQMYYDMSFVQLYV